MTNCDCGHVICWWRVVRVGAEDLPECRKIGSGVFLRSIAEGIAQAVAPELFIATEDLGEAVGLEQDAAARGKWRSLRRIIDAGDHSERRSGGVDRVHRAVGQGDQRGIVPSVDEFNLSQVGPKAQK